MLIHEAAPERATDAGLVVRGTELLRHLWQRARGRHRDPVGAARAFGEARLSAAERRALASVSRSHRDALQRAIESGRAAHARKRLECQARARAHGEDCLRKATTLAEILRARRQYENPPVLRLIQPRPEERAADLLVEASPTSDTSPVSSSELIESAEISLEPYEAELLVTPVPEHEEESTPITKPSWQREIPPPLPRDPREKLDS